EMESPLRARVLESGADGYLARTTPKREIQACLQALLRRGLEQAELREAVQLWRGALDCIAEPAYVVDTDNRILDCNMATVKLLGKAPSEIVGRPFYQLVPPAEEPIESHAHQRVRETRRRERLTVPGPTEGRWFDVTVDPLVDEAQSVRGFVHVWSDATERLLAEEARTQAREELERQLEEQREALAAAQQERQAVTLERQQAQEELGKAERKLESQARDNLAALARVDAALQAERAQREQAADQLQQMQEKVEEQRAVVAELEAKVEVLEAVRREKEQALDDAQQALHAESQERQRTEKELSQARGELEREVDGKRALEAQHEETQQALQTAGNDLRRAEQALRTAAGLVYEWDIESGEIGFFSDVDAKLYADAAEFPRTVEEFQQPIHPLDRQRLTAAIERHLQTGQPVAEEYRVPGEDGQVSYWKATGSVMWDEEGKPVKWVGTSRDVTAAKQAEQLQRMDAVARLAGGVAQELSELLTGVLGSSEVATAQVGPSHPLHSVLESIRATAQKALEMARRLLTISRQRLVELKAIDLNELITRLSEALAGLAGVLVDMKLELSDELKPVRGDEDALQQMLMALAENAALAMPEGGTLRVETQLVTVDSDYCTSHPGAEPGEYARLTVADSGGGVADELQAHAFEPFATASGLNLAVVHGIVRQLGGWVDTRAAPEQGTSLDIYLPLDGGG
ncbi:MAG: PAS domain S-box protein, partial [Anaerolineales bacterium]